MWTRITPATQSAIKQQLFFALESEAKSSVRNAICDAIGEIGGSILEPFECNVLPLIKAGQGPNLWPELKPMIWQMLGANQIHLIESAFLILEELFTYSTSLFMDSKQDLHVAFSTALIHSDNSLKVAAMKAFSSFIVVLEPNQCRSFDDLLPHALEGLKQLLASDQDLGDEALSMFTDISEAEPKFFKKHFQATFDTMHAITFNKSIDEVGIKKMATELIVSVVERIPSLIRKSAENLKKLFEMIFYQMIQIDEEIEEEWLKPKEGYNEDFEEDSDLEVVRFGMNAVDRLISSIGEKEALPILSQLVQTMLQHNDWRYKNAAILALSQVGEYIQSVAEVKPIIDVVLGFLNNPNPKIRYACCHCLGQIADDMQPEFQENFHGTVLSSLLNTLNDPVPRVSGHSAAAITNFVEGMTRESLSNYMKTLLQKCFELLNTGISLVKENCVSAIAATAETAGELFSPYFDEAAPLILSMMNTFTAKEYKQLRGQLIECLTLMAHAVGKEKFAPFSQQLIGAMILIQEGTFEKVDPQKSYLLSGWQRLCYVLGNDFAQYLPSILPSLFSLIQSIFNSSSETAESEAKDSEYNTYETEEAEVAINLLSVLIDEMKDAFVPYVVRAISIVVPLCDYKTNEGIRKSAAGCLPSIITCVKTTNLEDAKNSAKSFLNTLWNAVSTEHEPEVIQEQIEAMRDILNAIEWTFLDQNEMNAFFNQIIKLMMESDVRKAENEKAKHEEGIDDEEITMLNEETSREEEIHLSIADLIGTIFKTHKHLSVPLAELICTQILPKALEANQSEKMHKFGIFLIDDCIEYLGLELLSSKWEFFTQALLTFATNKAATVRQAAAYGIGNLGIQSREYFSPISDSCIGSLYESLKCQQGTDKPKPFGHSRDNTIAAIGKILKFQGERLSNPAQVYGVWLDNLPLKFDKQEAIGQNEFLADLVLANAPLVLETAPRVMKILGEILDTKTSTPEIRPKLVQAIKLLATHQNVAPQMNGILESLSVVQRKKVSDLFHTQ